MAANAVWMAPVAPGLLTSIMVCRRSVSLATSMLCIRSVLRMETPENLGVPVENYAQYNF